MKIQLYHFSNSDFKIIKSDFFGQNSYTANDFKYPQKRFFAYDVKNPLEYHLHGAKYRYTFTVDGSKVYNLDTDILKLKVKFSSDIDKILSYLAKNFDGVKYTHSFLCYAIFKSQSVKIQSVKIQSVNVQGQYRQVKIHSFKKTEAVK